MIEIAPYVPDSRTLDCILPIEPINTWEWMKENSYTKKGVPFNYFDYPWVKGIAEAWDNPDVKRIFFMAGSRLGKTEDGLSFMHAAQDHNPDVGMIIGPDQKIVEETIGDRFWPMLEKSPKTRGLCPHPSRRAKQKVKTATFTIYGAWSGSPATLGDKDPRYLALFEIDKYTKDKSEESDPFNLAMARGAEIPDRKLYAESTPTIEGRSRIAKYVALGTNRRFHVPCPHCGHHQELVWNEGTDRSAGGLWWDRDENGNANPNVAASTAVYICIECGDEIKEEQRRAIISRGVWCAEGQYVDDDGKLVGRPVNDGSDESFQISRLYGPTFSFSECAKAYAESRGTPEGEQSFENDWRGMPWVPLVVQMQAEDLAKKLCVGDWDVGTVPKPCVFVTTAVDVQLDHFVLGTFGWDRQATGYLIRHDTVPSWNDVEAWLKTPWPHEDGHPIFSLINLVDSKDGNRQEEVFSFCMSVNNPRSPWTWPLEGARYGHMGVKMFNKRELENKFGSNGNKKKRKNEIAGLHCIQVNTMMTQNWLDNAMVRRMPGDPMSIILPRQIIGDTDLFDQLLNERYDPREGKHVRIDESTIPVDFRDVFRYSRTAAEVFTNGRWERLPKDRPVSSGLNVGAASQQFQTPRVINADLDDAVTKPGFIRKPKNPFLRGRR
ncbi:Phage terminase large subunit (GpA) [Stieleria maiorica]|uniref:Phage terminase large subunit (GpA) n=2 Tax=Stieleria maiorica TaxID=2795974 RepID=A0A5B9MCC3_9BACT|nr:Phage terminase large subunit (GpA) [Stieleria maiorica]